MIFDLLIYNENSKFGAEKLAKPAPQTFIFLCCFGGIIALFVDLVRCFQHLHGTKVRTDSASLAKFLVNFDHPNAQPYRGFGISIIDKKIVVVCPFIYLFEYL